MKYKHHHIKDISDADIYLKNKLFAILGGRTPSGFYTYYFNDLPFHKNQIECFNHVNGLYFELYGEFRYSNYNSFRRNYNKDFKTTILK